MTTMRRGAVLVIAVQSILSHVNGFSTTPLSLHRRAIATPHPGPKWQPLQSNKANNYERVTPDSSQSPPPPKKATGSFDEPPYPKIGDVIRYYDIDGGKTDGETCVGKISLIQPQYGKNNVIKEWLVEIQKLEDVGAGYYAEYPSRKRRSYRTLRNLDQISPLMASFVRAEDAFKVPMDSNRIPQPRFERYKMEGYEGPSAVPVDETVLKSDMERYVDLKGMLIKDAAIVGLAGAIIAQFLKGTEDAIIYAAGAAAGVAYLYLLSVKTDTLGSQQAKFGKKISNVRFALPLLVLASISLKNSLSDPDMGVFSTVTTEQFSSAMIGFLTYRIPLFLRQLQPLAAESVVATIPGSVGVAMQMASKNDDDKASPNVLISQKLKPILLICGPPSTGKTTLVQQILDGNSQFVAPNTVDKIQSPAQFELLEKRDLVLTKDRTGRYGITAESILTTFSQKDSGDSDQSTQKVVVIDSNVDLAKKLVKIGGTRLIGVWVSLDSLEKFEQRIQMQIDKNELKIPKEESRESFVRAKIRDVVRDIEFGVVSGIFEFTILNDDLEESYRQLENAAQYCLK